MPVARYVFVLLSLLLASHLQAESMTLAVASNFARPAEDIVARFEAASGHSVRVTTASTGKLYAQIVNGAPFDVLLAADAERPRLLEESGLGVMGTRATYAIGRLYLYSRNVSFAGIDCVAQLATLGKRRLAIANPQTAPYGKAALEYLQKTGFLSTVEPQLVYGENISQAFLFVATGNAEIGLVANSQVAMSRMHDATCEWLVPEDRHSPIEQQVILLQKAKTKPAATEFLSFLSGAESRAVLSNYLYGLPQ
jgi:molybdate transport system substrate-binding protein